MATKAVTRGHGVGFGNPFIGTGNEVIAINICIEEFGICLQMLDFPLNAMYPVVQEGSWGSDVRLRRAGALSRMPRPLGLLSPPAV